MLQRGNTTLAAPAARLGDAGASRLAPTPERGSQRKTRTASMDAWPVANRIFGWSVPSTSASLQSDESAMGTAHPTDGMRLCEPIEKDRTIWPSRRWKARRCGACPRFGLLGCLPAQHRQTGAYRIPQRLVVRYSGPLGTHSRRHAQVFASITDNRWPSSSSSSTGRS